MKLLLLW